MHGRCMNDRIAAGKNGSGPCLVEQKSGSLSGTNSAYDFSSESSTFYQTFFISHNFQLVSYICSLSYFLVFCLIALLLLFYVHSINTYTYCTFLQNTRTTDLVQTPSPRYTQLPRALHPANESLKGNPYLTKLIWTL